MTCASTLLACKSNASLALFNAVFASRLRSSFSRFVSPAFVDEYSNPRSFRTVEKDDSESEPEDNASSSSLPLLVPEEAPPEYVKIPTRLDARATRIFARNRVGCRPMDSCSRT